MRNRTRRTLAERFAAKAIRTEGCWGWSGAIDATTGYSRISVQTETGWRQRGAHRIAYELHVGPIADGLHIDHLCRNRWCVNPAHLEAVTQRENILRGVAPSALSVRENRCRAGHEYTAENTHVKKNGKRECRACARARDRIRRPPLRALRKP